MKTNTEISSVFSLNSLHISLGSVAVLFLFSGCYTQLYTQNYVARDQQNYAADSRDALADSLEDSSLVNKDSSISKRPIIVKNYYEENNYYRGHRYSDWDDPLISLSFSSGYYREYYSRPYWEREHYGNYYSDQNHYHSHYYSSPNNNFSSNTYNPPRKRLFSSPSNAPLIKPGKRREKDGGNVYASPSGSMSKESASAPEHPSHAVPSSDNSSNNDSGDNSESSKSDENKPMHKGRR